MKEVLIVVFAEHVYRMEEVTLEMVVPMVGWHEIRRCTESEIPKALGRGED